VLTAGLERMAMCRQMRSVQLAARKYRKAFRALVALKSFGPSRPGDAPRDQYANDSRNEDTNESTNNAVGPEYRKRHNVDDADNQLQRNIGTQRKVPRVVVRAQRHPAGRAFVCVGCRHAL